jgi:hypothetical protein
MNILFTTIRRARRVPLIGVAAGVGAVLTGLVIAAQPPVASALPQRLVASGDSTVDPNATTGHGWVFVPTPGAPAEGDPKTGGHRSDRASGYLLHIVPRQGLSRASAGSVRMVIPLTSPPLAIASSQGTAILLQGPPGDDAVAPAERTVSTFAASTLLGPGAWDYQPTDRLQLRAALPGDTIPRSMSAASMSGTVHGPVVVWERAVAPAGGSAAGELEIAVLDESGGWCTLEPPPGFPKTAADGEAHTLAAPSGVLVAVRATGDAVFTLWHAAPPPDVTPPASPKVRRSTMPLPTRWLNSGTAALPESVRSGPIRTIGAAAPCWLWRSSGETLLAARKESVITLWRLDTATAVELWRSQPLPTNCGALTVAGLDAATILAYDPPAPTTQGAPAIPELGKLRTIDVSLLTGAVLADLSAHTDGFLTRTEMAILWGLFILIGVVILTVVLRTDGPQEVQLPEGTALASPVRRVVAGLIDIAAAVAVTSLILGGSPSHWLAPTTSTNSSLLPLAGVFFFGCLICTVCEAVVGGSPGKLLVGARVLGLVPASPVSADGGSRQTPTIWTAGQPRLHQALLRNAVRWFMPGMGAMMVLDNNWRHPGDILARTVVVVRFDPEDEPPPGSSDGDQ